MKLSIPKPQNTLRASRLRSRKLLKNIHITGSIIIEHKEYYRMKRISKPGLRVYAASEELPRVLGGLGVAIIYTNKGVMTDKEARNANVGGEVLAFIW